MYFWVVDYKQAGDGNLRPIIIGGRAFSSELLAQRYLDDANLSRKAEIFPLETGNVGRASQTIKAILVRRYKSLDKGTKRAVHKL